MSNKIVSSVHCLKLVSVDKISRFARFGSKVKMLSLHELEDARAVPGSIEVNPSANDGIFTKNITYLRADVSPEVSENLEAMRNSRLIAIYVDETGSLRVCGSPDYPLTLDYFNKGGVFHVILSGKDTVGDAFLVE